METLFASRDCVFRGYVDDPRNTDNAWTETTAFHFHCSAELGGQLQLGSGSDAQAVKWMYVDEAGREDDEFLTLYGDHRALVERAVRRMDGGVAHDSQWGIAGWLRSLNIVDIVGEALQEPPGTDPFAYALSLSRDRLEHLLKVYRIVPAVRRCMTYVVYRCIPVSVQRFPQHCSPHRVGRAVLSALSNCRALQAAQLGGLLAPIWAGLESLHEQAASSGAALNNKFEQAASSVVRDVGQC